MQRAYRPCRRAARGTVRRRARPPLSPNAADTNRGSPAVRLRPSSPCNAEGSPAPRRRATTSRALAVQSVPVPVDEHQPAVGVDRVGCEKLAVCQHHSLGLTCRRAREIVVAGEPIVESSGVHELAGRFSVGPLSPSDRQPMTSRATPPAARPPHADRHSSCRRPTDASSRQ
jgi:hypothetical protein